MKKVKYGLKIGMKLEIIITRNEKEKVYSSQLLEIKEKKEAKEIEQYIIGGPITKNGIIAIGKDEDIQVTYIIKNKCKIAFDAKVVSSENSRIYSLRVSRTSEFKEIQNRNYFRIPTEIDVLKCWKVKESEVDNECNMKEKCKAKDISGGGIGLYSNSIHKENDIVACVIDLPERKLLIKCKVVRVVEVESKRFKYLIGLMYLDIEDEDRESIIKFIFDKQRDMRIKGLL